MKTQQSTTVPTAVCPFGAQTPINPVFVESLNNLRDIFSQIYNICEDETNPQYDTVYGHFEDFEEYLNKTVFALSEIARVDFIERQFYTRKEACNA